MEIGDSLDNFKLVEMLGKGGQGVVYKALDTKLERFVAVKVFSPELNGKKRYFERFEREAKLASTLDHPNISTIYSLFEQDGYHCIAMQYVEGINLHDFAQDRPLEIKSALNIIIQVTEALVAAHKQNIVHRDIKARNVMVDDEGRVTVLDFGLAKLIDDEAEENLETVELSADETFSRHSPQDAMATGASDIHLTERGEPYGTPASSAPEMALGEASDFRVDIFSVGVLLYLLLTGKFPFPAKKIDEVRDKIINDDYVPLSAARNADETVPPRLEKVVDRALQKNPADRFQTATEMRDELLAVLREVETDEQGSADSPAPAFIPAFMPTTAPAHAAPRRLSLPKILTAVAILAGATIVILLLINYL